jgi:hypothetical protein
MSPAPAVDPQTGDVVYVYGNRDPTTGNNRLATRRPSSPIVRTARKPREVMTMS